MKFAKQSDNEYIGNLDQDSDLMESLEKFAIENNIQSGVFSVIGAVKNSEFGFYDQKEKKYRSMFLEEPAEILHCTGNITLRDGKPFVHAHITLADREGKAYGGHLIRAKVFAGEVYVKKFEKGIGRELDPGTGLALLDLK